MQINYCILDSMVMRCLPYTRIEMMSGCMRRVLISSNARVCLFTSIQLHFSHQPVRGGNSLSASPTWRLGLRVATTVDSALIYLFDRDMVRAS